LLRVEGTPRKVNNASVLSPQFDFSADVPVYIFLSLFLYLECPLIDHVPVLTPEVGLQMQCLMELVLVLIKENAKIKIKIKTSVQMVLSLRVKTWTLMIGVSLKKMLLCEQR
jgi:hypothetical protein